jgi:glycosyltransferase 2 family protein
MAAAISRLWGSGESLGAHLAGVSFTALAVGLALHALKLALRARAWQNILRAALPQERVRYRDAAVPYLAGVGAGSLVPFGGGQLLLVALARARLRGATAATVVGTLAVERALDTVVAGVIVPLALAGSFLPGNGFAARSATITASLSAHPLLLVSTTCALCAVAAATGWLVRGRLAAMFVRFGHGLRALRSPKQYAGSVASWQLLSWGLRFVALCWFLRAFHIPGGIATALLVLAVQLLAGLVPFTPGGAGSQQALIALTLAGTTSGTALVGFSAGSQAATILLNLTLGGMVLAATSRSVRIRNLRLVARGQLAVH